VAPPLRLTTIWKRGGALFTSIASIVTTETAVVVRGKAVFFMEEVGATVTVNPLAPVTPCAGFSATTEAVRVAPARAMVVMGLLALPGN